MIKPKAPKDMTATEFVALFESRYPGNEIYRSVLKKILAEPAPNPFTPDQIAWMRVEQQDNGIMYAAMNEAGIVSFFRDCPIENTGHGERFFGSKFGSVKRSSTCFLVKVLSVDDPEPLCFADFAPLTYEREHKEDL